MLLCVIGFSLHAQDAESQTPADKHTGSDSSALEINKSGSSDEKKDTAGPVSPDGEKDKSRPDGKTGVNKNPAQKQKATAPKLQPKKDEKKDAAQKEKNESSEAETDKKINFNGHGLLITDEGDETIRRIPGVTIEKKQPAAENIVKIPSETVEVNTPPDEDGLFGMSRSRTVTVAKVFFVVFLFLMFILYRAKTRGSRKRVVRMYHKK